jgi:hypothetical protein
MIAPAAKNRVPGLSDAACRQPVPFSRNARETNRTLFVFLRPTICATPMTFKLVRNSIIVCKQPM